MANETTRTSHASMLFTEVMSGRIISAHLPKMVAAAHMHQDTLDGAGGGTKQYPKFADDGQASALTEGTAFTTNNEFDMGTAPTATPTEIGAQGVITDRNIQKQPLFRGLTSWEVLKHGTDQQREAIFAPEIMRLGAMVMEKVEATALALFSGVSESVGSSGVDITLANWLQSVYELRANEPLHENFVTVLTENQLYELQLEALSASGGVAGSLWMSQADASALAQIRPDMSLNGLRGGLLNVPIYAYSPSLNVTANSGANVVGCTFCAGYGPTDAVFDGKVGAFAMVEGAPLKIEFDRDLNQRGTRVQVIYETVGVELVDLNAIAIITDA